MQLYKKSKDNPEAHQDLLNRIMMNEEGTEDLDNLFVSLKDKFQEIDKVWLEQDEPPQIQIRPTVKSFGRKNTIANSQMAESSSVKKVESRGSAMWRQKKSTVLSGLRLRMNSMVVRPTIK